MTAAPLPPLRGKSTKCRYSPAHSLITSAVRSLEQSLTTTTSSSTPSMRCRDTAVSTCRMVRSSLYAGITTLRVSIAARSIHQAARLGDLVAIGLQHARDGVLHSDPGPP